MANKPSPKKPAKVITTQVEPEEVIVESEVQEIVAEEKPDEEAGETTTDETPAEATISFDLGGIHLEKQPETTAVTFDAPFMPEPVRNVHIALKVDHTCNIGGVRYQFKANTRYTVPANVKAILKRANLLAAL